MFGTGCQVAHKDGLKYKFGGGIHLYRLDVCSASAQDHHMEVSAASCVSPWCRWFTHHYYCRIGTYRVFAGFGSLILHHQVMTAFQIPKPGLQAEGAGLLLSGVALKRREGPFCRPQTTGGAKFGVQRRRSTQSRGTKLRESRDFAGFSRARVFRSCGRGWRTPRW